MKKHGVKAEYLESPVGTSDFTPYLTKIAEMKPEIVMLAHWGVDAINVLKQSYEIGLKKKTKIWFNWMTNVFGSGVPAEALEGVYSLMSWYYNMTGFKDAAVVKAAKDFSRKFRKEYGYPPDPYSAMAYIGTIEALRGIELAQSTDPDAVAKALMKSPELRLDEGARHLAGGPPADVQVRRLRGGGQGSEGAEGSQVGPRQDRGRVFGRGLSSSPVRSGLLGSASAGGGGAPPPPRRRRESPLPEEVILETRGVTKRFDGFAAVSGVSYRLREGEAAGIIGPNGAGKTTFFNLLTGMFPPTEGTVLYRGDDITRIPAHERVRRGIVRTFQLVSVFDSLTVRENLVLALIRAGKAQAASAGFFLGDAWSGNLAELSAEALETVGLREKALWKTAELSYGDKRKLEIALALSLRPAVLLLDEPFAGLSDVEIVEVLELIRRVRADFTLVIIEHKISRIVDLVSRLSVMHEGKLIAEGEPAEVLADPLVRQVYWGRP